MTEPVITKAMIRAHPEMATMAKLELFVVVSTSAQGLGPILANMQAHVQHQIDLERRGIMFAAGPLFGEDDSEWAGDGMCIIRAASFEHAVEIAKADPMHQSGARTFRVRPWMVNEGSVSISITLSSGAMSIA